MFYKIFIGIKSAFLVRKNRKLFAEKKYAEISLNLKEIYNMHSRINKTLDKSYIYWLQKIDLDFRTYNYSEIEKNMDIAIKSVDYTSKKESEDTKRYRKVFLYSIYFLVYLLNDNKEKSSNIKLIIKKLSTGVEGLPAHILYDRTVYFKERMIKLFKDDLYYKKNYSEEKLNQIIIEMDDIDKYTNNFFIITKEKSNLWKKIIKVTILIIFPLSLFIFLMFKGLIELSIAILFLWIILLYIYNIYKDLL